MRPHHLPNRFGIERREILPRIKVTLDMLLAEEFTIGKTQVQAAGAHSINVQCTRHKS
jgi:hypothetical protein